MKPATNKIIKVLLLPLLIILGMISCTVGKLPSTFEMLFTLALGWVVFLKNVVFKAHVYWPSICTGIIAFIVLTLCVHSIFSWLAKEKVIFKDEKEGFRWKLKWSVYAVFLLILGFVAGIAIISLIHQSFWFFQDISAKRVLK
jgi:hypothetical protein